MHGRRSLNLELTPLDPDLERKLGKREELAVRWGIVKGIQEWRSTSKIQGMKRSTRSTKMREVGTERTDERMSWISLRHSENCSHLLRSVPIRA
jgi:hypothetical protein